ncbi:dicarboxylate/amino acid:cation symporter [Pelagerythrobacter marensis]|uniref:Proton/glutamate symporter n=1 Tax=Pelagerythrobacter marensis TaxID=543877 RepID=A0A0G3X889_9SPHN|nr:dicarboxylate/amino acid:cation symporter [Pelagerythrobacter marensis]AKM06558.1 Proton/glutamate symporter [Pelagerythrobacter marensis]
MIRSLASRWFAIVLWKRILVALVLGALAGLALGESAEQIRWIGDLFIRMIRMLIVPLVFVTLVSGVIAMKDPKRLGSIGSKAIALYLGTTFFAIVIGIGLALLFRPGVGIDLSGAEATTLQEAGSLADRLLGIVPENPFAAFAEGNVLAVIFFAIMVGAGLIMAAERGQPLARVFESGSETMLKVTAIVMEFAPFGVFALVAWVMGTVGPGTFLNVFLLAIAVYLGCFLHMLIVHGAIVKFFARLPVLPFYRGVREPQLVAYSTSSSSATLPASLSAAEHNLGIKPPVASSVLPLGATINMDGTALYVALISIFAAQAFGVPLDLFDYLLIGLTTTLVSVGTASVPSASLFLMAAVLNVIGMSAAQTAIVVGFILPFDRILDMMRTVANVTGDLAVATVVAVWEDEIDRDTYNALPTE